MKWALVTTLIAYVVWWQFAFIQQFILPIGLVLVLGFSLYLTKQKMEVLPSTRDKLKVLVYLLLFSLIFTLLLYYLITSNILPSYYFPPILGLIVLSRGFIRWLINLTTREPKSFGIMSETDRGETVRSKAEKKVADWLFANEYDYVYERQITLPDGSTILSDFYLIDTDIYIEYWGLSGADNEVGEKYRARKYEKIDLYEQHGYKMISLYPHHLYELDRYIPDQIAILTGKKSRGFWSWFRSLFGGTKSTTSVSNSSSTSSYPPQTSPPLFCTSCGNEVTEVGDFCVKCGTQVT